MSAVPAQSLRQPPCHIKERMYYCEFDVQFTVPTLYALNLITKDRRLVQGWSS
jgi:hypothetical protein